MSKEEKIEYIAKNGFRICSITSNGWITFERYVYNGFVFYRQTISMRLSFKERKLYLIKYNL